MTDPLEEAQRVLARDDMPRDENTFTALWIVLKHLRAASAAATVRECADLPDTLKTFRDWSHDESGISSTYQLTRNQALQLLSWAGVARHGRTLELRPLILDDDEDEKPAEAEVSADKRPELTRFAEELAEEWAFEPETTNSVHERLNDAFNLGHNEGRSSAARELAEKYSSQDPLLVHEGNIECSHCGERSKGYGGTADSATVCPMKIQKVSALLAERDETIRSLIAERDKLDAESEERFKANLELEAKVRAWEPVVRAAIAYDEGGSVEDASLVDQTAAAIPANLRPGAEGEG